MASTAALVSLRLMSHPAPLDPAVPARWTADRYLRLVDEGVLGPEDGVELLEGVIVAMAPQNEIRRRPEPEARRYASTAIARRGERIELTALPGVTVAVNDLMPSPAT